MVTTSLYGFHDPKKIIFINNKIKVVAKTDFEHHIYIYKYPGDDNEKCNQFWSHFEPANTTVTFMYLILTIHYKTAKQRTSLIRHKD